MTKIMLLFSLLTVACTQAPKKDYRWVSLSEKGFTENHLQVLKEDKKFHSDGGFENLVLEKKPLPEKSTAEFKKIIILGDTGCRLKETKYGERYQNCKDLKEWPYPTLISRILTENPDLIIHTGDYHYREECSEGKVCRQYTDVIGKGWRAWDADFFSPSALALQKIPWLFLRGNHEDCSRAFEGYHLLSEQNRTEKCPPYEKTEFVRIGNLLLVNLDTSKLTDREEPSEVVAFWEKQFKDIETYLRSENSESPIKQVWLLTHRPVAALVVDFREGLSPTNRNLQKAFAKSGLASKIEFIISGHLHSSQLLKAEGFPKQLVVGHSGTSLDNTREFKEREKILKKTFGALKITNFVTDTLSAQSFGYAIMEKAADGINWRLALKDLEGRTTFEYLETATSAPFTLRRPSHQN